MSKTIFLMILTPFLGGLVVPQIICDKYGFSVKQTCIHFLLLKMIIIIKMLYRNLNTVKNGVFITFLEHFISLQYCDMLQHAAP